MRRVDLNLLYVLRELLKEPNTTKVAEKLNLTQSAVSAALGRLRWAFQDDLFVRSGRAMAPTKRAEDLLEPVEDIIQRIENLVEEVHFEPANLSRSFSLATTDFLLQAISGLILAEVHPLAPNARVVFAPLGADTRDRVRSGHTDLIIAPFQAAFQGDEQISTQALYTDHLVAAVSEDSDKYGDSISEQELVEATHVEFNPTLFGNAQGWKSTTQLFMEERDLQVKTIAECINHTALLYALRYSDVIALMPRKLVDVFGKDAGVKPLALPYETPEFEVGLMWNSAQDKDPEHLWFRERVAMALDSL